MISSDSSADQWGYLTSLHPDFPNISLIENPSVLGFENEQISKEYKCQVYHDKGSFFIHYTGDHLFIEVEDRIVQENKAFESHFRKRGH